MNKLITISLVIAILSLVQGDYVYEDDVIVLKNRIFEKALGDFPYLLVEFYSPGCSHCLKLAPEYSQAAALLKKHNMILAKVDASEDKILSAKYKIHGYPHILFFKAGLKMDYNGPRTSQGIVDWVLEHSKPFFDVIEYQEDLSKVIEQNEFSLLYFERQGEKTTRKQEQVLADLTLVYPQVKFILVRQPQLRENYNIQDDIFIALLDKGKQSIYSGNPLIKDNLNDFIESQVSRLVNTFSQFQEANDRKRPGIIFWENKERSQFKDDFFSLAQEFRGQFSFIHVSGQDLEEEKEFLLQMRVSGMSNGAIFICDYKQDLKYKMENQLSLENIREFIEKFKAQSLTPMKILRRQFIRGTVQELTASDFQSFVIDSQEDVLVEFYAPWCGHCKNLEPIYSQLAMELKNNKNIMIAKVDATKHQIQDYPVKGYPTIKFFKKGDQSEVMDYQGGRNLEGFRSFLKLHASYEWVEKDDL